MRIRWAVDQVLESPSREMWEDGLEIFFHSERSTMNRDKLRIIFKTRLRDCLVTFEIYSNQLFIFNLFVNLIYNNNKIVFKDKMVEKKELQDNGLGPITNMRSEAHVELKQANIAFNACLSKNFLPGWLQGQDIQLSEVCGAELEDMQEKNSALYGESPMPFSGVRLPTMI